ncbi:MAG: hypothetical protein JNM33_17540 [Rubrivivax sp.]|nr:hypothetical protein [Rubrivivax sp.]
MKRIELHIDRLVLHGVPAAERDAAVARFTQALQAALAEPGAAQAWARQGHQARLRVAVPPAPGGGGASWPAAAAQALSAEVRR